MGSPRALAPTASPSAITAFARCDRDVAAIGLAILWVGVALAITQLAPVVAGGPVLARLIVLGLVAAYVALVARTSYVLRSTWIVGGVAAVDLLDAIETRAAARLTMRRFAVVLAGFLAVFVLGSLVFASCRVSVSRAWAIAGMLAPYLLLASAGTFAAWLFARRAALRLVWARTSRSLLSAELAKL